MNKTKGNLDKAKALKQIRTQINKLKKKEKELTDFFKEKLDTGESFDGDGITIECQEVISIKLDKEMLADDLGESVLSKYEYESPYKKLFIKTFK